MKNQFSLFQRRYFNAMFFTQFFGAFNDNIFKQALILILTYTAAAKLGMKISLLNNLAALLFILPYFLFSALAGQVADKYEKSRLTYAIKLLEIVIMSLAALGFLFEWYWLLFVALFLMGTQSTFFGPIKYAYLPEAIPSQELVAANGLIQTSTSLAILVGMIVAGVLTQLAHASYWLISITLLMAILGLSAASFIPKTKVHAQDLQINWNIFQTSWQIISYLYSLPLLFFVVMGNSWFWFYGATFLTQTPEISKSILQADESVVILLLTLFSVGIALGSLICKSLTKNQVSLRLLPFGILGLSVFAGLLYISLFSVSISPTAGVLDIWQIFSVDGVWLVFVSLFLLGFFGGIYIVPLYTCMQAYSPASHRSRIVGANNIFNALFMVISAIFAILILTVLKLDLAELFLIVSLANALFGIFLYKKLKQYQGSLPIHQDPTSAQP